MQRWQEVKNYVVAELKKAVLYDYDVVADEMVYRIEHAEEDYEVLAFPRFFTDERYGRIHPDDREAYAAALRRGLATAMSGSVEYRGSYFSKEYHWCRSSFVSLAEGEGSEVTRIVGRVEDIDEEKRLQHQVNRDALTGFYNQIATKTMIESSLEGNQHGCLFVIDIDDFKMINDNLGHLFGDSFLQEVSSSLRKVFRDEDILGRIGGDEFVAFVPGELSETVIEKKARSILDAFSGIEVPRLGGVHASVGISVVEQDSYHDYVTLFKKADRALYKAKGKGKNCFVIYHSKDDCDNLPLSIISRSTKGGAVSESSSWSHSLTGDVFSILYHAERTHDGVNEALAHVGRWLDVSRVYIFEKDNGMLANTFEWCNVGIPSEIDNLQNIPDGGETGEELYIENFDIDNIFYLRYAEDAPEWQREILEPQGIKSMLQYGIIEKNELVGFVGFDECTENVFWTKEQVEVLTRIAQMISVFLRQLRTV